MTALLSLLHTNGDLSDFGLFTAGMAAVALALIAIGVMA